MPVTNYIYDGNQYLAEADENDTVNRVFTNEPDAYTHLISQEEVSAADSLYYHYDAVGSTREVTDDTESVTDEFTYDAWGNRLSRTGTSSIPFQYVGALGYYFDNETGSNYVQARSYQPTIARWSSTDPLGLVEGLNLYEYVYSNPIAHTDPSGLQIVNRVKVTKKYECSFEWFLGAAFGSTKISCTSPFGRRGANLCHRVLGLAHPAICFQCIAACAGGFGGAFDQWLDWCMRDQFRLKILELKHAILPNIGPVACDCHVHGLGE